MNFTVIVDFLVTLGIPVIVGYCTFIERRFSRLSSGLSKKLDQDEVLDIVNIRLKEFTVEISSIKDYLQRIEQSINDLRDKLWDIKPQA